MNFRNIAGFRLSLFSALAVACLGGCAVAQKASVTKEDVQIAHSTPLEKSNPPSSSEVEPASGAVGPAGEAAATPQQNAAPAERVLSATEMLVKERANTRWQNLLKKDFDASYQLMAPSFRASTSLEDYRKRFGSAVQWVGADVFAVVCEEDHCAVTMEIKVKPLLPKRAAMPFSTTLEETWVKEGGQWWYGDVRNKGRWSGAKVN